MSNERGIPRGIADYSLGELMRLAHAAWDVRHLLPHPDDTPTWSDDSDRIREFNRALDHLPPLPERHQSRKGEA